MSRPQCSQDEVNDAVDALVDAVAEGLVGRIVERIEEQLLARNEVRGPPEGAPLPPRSRLIQREATAFTGLSVSTLRRARRNGLPWEMALGQVTYALEDLEALMAGRYNGP